MNRITVAFFLFIFPFSMASTGVKHPLKLSVTTVTYKNQKLQFTYSLFSDDLEVELTTYCKKTVAFEDGPLPKATANCLEQYFQQNFSCSINHAPVTLHFKKAEVVFNDAGIRSVRSIYESALINNSTLKSIQIKNTLLFRFMGTQKNIVNIDLFQGAQIKILQFENAEGNVTKEINF